MKKLKFIVLLTSLLVASCGFHLRGAYQIPESLQFVVIQGDIGSELLAAIKQQFIQTGINVIDDAENIPRAFINLSEASYSKSVNTLATNGQISDYNLDYSVVFNVESSERLKLTSNAITISNQKVQIHRLLTANQSSVLASSNEEATIKSEMNKELARSILFRIQALTKRKPVEKY